MAAPDRQPKKTIRQLRQARGWSQMDLALRLGVEQGTISAWELGRRVPRAKSLQRLAELFHLDVEVIAFEPAAQEPQDRL